MRRVNRGYTGQEQPSNQSKKIGSFFFHFFSLSPYLFYSSSAATQMCHGASRDTQEHREVPTSQGWAQFTSKSPSPPPPPLTDPFPSAQPLHKQFPNNFRTSAT
jgi:hypothetical protein